jgi:hypothetical protein
MPWTSMLYRFDRLCARRWTSAEAEAVVMEQRRAAYRLGFKAAQQERREAYRF